MSLKSEFTKQLERDLIYGAPKPTLKRYKVAFAEAEGVLFSDETEVSATNPEEAVRAAYGAITHQNGVGFRVREVPTTPRETHFRVVTKLVRV